MIRALLLALALAACSGDWTAPCDLAPKQPLDTQSDCAGAERVPWQDLADPSIVFAPTDAGADAPDDAGEAGAP